MLSCRMRQCQCATINVWRHTSLLMPSIWRATESIREESCWGGCLSSGDRQTWISDPVFACYCKTPLYREQFHMETVWSTVCASRRICTQSESGDETASASWRLRLPLHVGCPASKVFLDRDVRSGSESWNTWTLCAMRLNWNLRDFPLIVHTSNVHLLC